MIYWYSIYPYNGRDRACETEPIGKIQIDSKALPETIISLLIYEGIISPEDAFDTTMEVLADKSKIVYVRKKALYTIKAAKKKAKGSNKN